MARLLIVEMRRALHRRAVWALVATALAGIALLGVVAWADSTGKSTAELIQWGQHPAVMRTWWIPGTADGVLMMVAVPLLLGGLLGGASVAGAEWRFGTMTTVLTWEPRRVRLHAARLASCFVLATVIAAVLQALYLAASLPAVFAHGTTTGVDAAWWAALAGAIGRLSLVTGGAALLGAALGTIGRGTTFAVGVAVGWVAAGEAIVRSLKPSLRHLLLGENIAIAVPWAELEGAAFSRSTAVAALTVAAYVALAAGVSTVLFARLDVTSSS